jgi:hypothetical protein
MNEEFNINTVTGEVIISLAKTSASNVYNAIKKHYKDIKTKEEIDFGVAFEKYLELSYNSYRKIKTLIYRQEPKDLYSFYECIGVSCGKRKFIDTKSIHNIINVGHKIIIIGTGGIGKTTMLKHFFINTIKETDYIPVLVELRKFNDKDVKDISISDAIYESLTNFSFDIDKKNFEYSMETGCYVILLDGYDEVKQEITQKVTKEISNTSVKYPNNFYILSSRPNEEFISWNDFTEMRALPLNKEQALSLIDKLEFNEEIKKVFYEELKNSLYDKYESFASNPLLLTIMLLTFENRASIPDKLNDFYEQAFATLFNIHDATKGGAFKRDIRCKLGCEDFKLVFAYICFKSYFVNQYEFSEASILEYIDNAKTKFKDHISFETEDFKEDLVKSVCMLVREGLNYRFSHRSFQEYFSAWYTCKLTDDIQEKLVSGWIKESGFYGKDSYLSMLYNLQNEKFNKIILKPGIKKIKNYYEQNSFLDFLDILFSGISVSEDPKNNYRIGLRVKDRYLCTILSMSCRFNAYNFPDRTHSNSSIGEYLFKKYFKKQGDRSIIDFEELKSMDNVEEVLNDIEWVKSEIEFSINLLEKMGEDSIGNKRKVISILEQL